MLRINLTMEYTSQFKPSYRKPEPTNFTIITKSTHTYLLLALQDILMQYTKPCDILFGN